MTKRSLTVNSYESHNLIRFEFTSGDKSIRWSTDYDCIALKEKDDSYDYYDIEITSDPFDNKICELTTDGLKLWFRQSEGKNGSQQYRITEEGYDSYGFWIRKSDKYVSCYQVDEWADIVVSYVYPANSKSAKKTHKLMSPKELEIELSKLEEYFGTRLTNFDYTQLQTPHQETFENSYYCTEDNYEAQD